MVRSDRKGIQNLKNKMKVKGKNRIRQMKSQKPFFSNEETKTSKSTLIEKEPYDGPPAGTPPPEPNAENPLNIGFPEPPKPTESPYIPEDPTVDDQEEKKEQIKEQFDSWTGYSEKIDPLYQKFVEEKLKDATEEEKQYLLGKDGHITKGLKVKGEAFKQRVPPTTGSTKDLDNALQKRISRDKNKKSRNKKVEDADLEEKAEQIVEKEEQLTGETFE